MNRKMKIGIGMAYFGIFVWMVYILVSTILFGPHEPSDVNEYLGTSSGTEIRSPAANWDEAFEGTRPTSSFDPGTTYKATQ